MFQHSNPCIYVLQIEMLEDGVIRDTERPRLRERLPEQQVQHPKGTFSGITSHHTGTIHVKREYLRKKCDLVLAFCVRYADVSCAHKGELDTHRRTF